MTNNNIYFIANWKMFGSNSSIKNINKLISLSKSKKFKNVKIIYCPPYTIINKFYHKTKNSRIQIGAQNCHHGPDEGAFTGSISSKMIKNSGANYVILGHSENRSENDTNKIINAKIISAQKNNLKVILCIGESLTDNKKKKTKKVLKIQLEHCLKKVKNINNFIFAYEPIWSIGTGLIPKINDLQKIILFIRSILTQKYKNQKISVIYGGSVSSKNINDLKQINQLNGYLIGGASRNQKKFIDIIKKTII